MAMVEIEINGTTTLIRMLIKETIPIVIYVRCEISPQRLANGKTYSFGQLVTPILILYIYIL